MKNNILIATFSDDGKAIEGIHKLNDLDLRGDIVTYNNVLLKRNMDGSFEYLKDDRDFTPWATVGGMLAGGLVGAIGGPVGSLVGLFTGMTAGGITDAFRYSFDYDFLETFKKGLPAGTTSLIAEVDEPSDAFVNNALQPLGATIWRSSVYSQKNQYFQSQLDEMDKAIDEADRELDAAVDAEKAEIQAKLADLRAKRDAKVAEINASIQKEIAEMKKSIEDTKATLKGNVEDARRKVLEFRLARVEERIKKYSAEAEKLNAEITPPTKAKAA